MDDRRRCRILLVAVLVFGSFGAFATEDLSIPTVVFPTAPVIDGVLDDEVWETAATVEGFVQFQPEFGVPSPFRTVVLVGYTSEALYVAFRCFDSDPGRIAAAVTSRDGNLKDDDSVTVLLDTNLDRRTAYYFATNSLGVRTTAAPWTKSGTRPGSRPPPVRPRVGRRSSRSRFACSGSKAARTSAGGSTSAGGFPGGSRPRCGRVRARMSGGSRSLGSSPALMDFFSASVGP